MLDENITFEADGTPQCVTIHIANDSLVEEEESFTVILFNPSDSVIEFFLKQLSTYLQMVVSWIDCV